jgi:APA family basic amino acid/polyamine antiporter
LAERHPREAALRRVHGPGALFAAAYGNVGSSIYYALGLVAVYALGLTPVTFIIAGIIFAFTAATYVEATVLYPEAGGSSSFARHGFNEFASFLAGWAQMLTYIVTVAISAFFVPHYLAVFWEPLGHGPGDVFFGIGLVVLLAMLNIKGTEESTRLNIVLAVADLLTQIVLAVIGLALVFNPDLLVRQVDLGTVPSWGDFALGIAVGMVAYTGIETISNMSEEARDSSRTVPRGTSWVVGAVVGIYALLPAIALSAMPVTQNAAGEYTTELGTKFADDPVLGIVENLGLSHGLTDGLRIYVGILAAVILLIATNAGLIGLSRLTFSMGQHRQLPEILRAIHPRFKTPYIAIIVFSLVAIVVMAPGETAFLGTIYAFGATLSFSVAHVSLIRLRKLRPLDTRPLGTDGEPMWHSPGSVWIRGVQVPVLAVLGGLGTFGAFVVAMVLDPVVLATGGGWMIAGTLLYIAYRRYKELPLTTTVKVESLTPLGVAEVEYKSILVAFDEEVGFDADAVSIAKTLASRRGRAIHVLALVTVPSNLPIGAELPEAERAAQTKIERAKLICGQRVSGHIARVRLGASGQAIVDEAKAISAAAIVMPLRYRDGAPLYGKTLQTVLARRPCRVIVSAMPGEQLDLRPPAAVPPATAASR